MTGRRAFQVLLAILGLVPIITGAITVVGGVAFTGVEPTATLDSDYRFFGGLWFGLGLAILWMLPHPERYGALIRAVAAAILTGGLARLLSMSQMGWPDTWSLVALERFQLISAHSLLRRSSWRTRSA